VLAIRWAVAAYRLSRASRLWAPGTIDGVSVWMTDDVGPAVSGVFRPRVLAPSWLHTLPGRERSLVLMHEQEHIRARDPLLVACARIARVLAPWNPVVWVLSWRLVRAVELDCDRRVLRRTSDVAAYGRTLFTVSRRRPGRLVAAAAFAESEAPLRSRILSMTTPPGTISVVALVSSTILGVVLLLGANQIPVPATGTGVQVVPEPDQTPTVTAFDAPPTPPPPPPPTRLVVRQSIGPNGEVVARVPSEPAWAPNGATLAPALEPPSAARELERVRQARERRLAPTPTPAPDPMAPAAVPPAGVEQVPEPAFTPMTIRPQLTNAPEVQQALMGEYPAALRDAGIGGAPVLWVHIGAGGSVDATRVAESSGFQALDEAAQRVASAMRFSPARNGDQVVPVWVQVPIRFAVVR
jgi:TonB family protein